MSLSTDKLRKPVPGISTGGIIEVESDIALLINYCLEMIGIIVLG
jgi:hypothetical protein